MVPSAFVFLSALPLTPNGKVDRNALPKQIATPDAELVAPRNALEEMLVALWKEVLGVERIGVRDDFFALGGHSLHAAQIVTLLRRKFRVKVPLRSVFDATTVERLAAVMQQILDRRSTS